MLVKFESLILTSRFNDEKASFAVSSRVCVYISNIANVAFDETCSRAHRIKVNSYLAATITLAASCARMCLMYV